MTRSPPLQRKTRECRIAASSQTSSIVTIKEPPDSKVLHRGVKDTLTELRSRYWITKGRQEAKVYS